MSKQRPGRRVAGARHQSTPGRFVPTGCSDEVEAVVWKQQYRFLLCRSLALDMPPRRFTTLIFVVAVSLTALFIFSSSTRQIASQAVEAVPQALPENYRPKLPTFEVPDFRISWHKSAHKPPEQKNSTREGTSWYSDWRWLNPFSSSVTLDEDRAVLPPLPERPPVYTYYETPSKKNEETAKIDRALLLTWRRAWWAKGFRPVVLSEAEAMNNPLYLGLHAKGMPKVLEFEFMRWLAWGHMGTGLLSSWHCVPMAAYNDLLLSHLRRGQFEHLTRFEGIGAGLFAGEKTQVNDALKEALDDARLSTHKTMIEAINSERFKVEQPSCLAHYDSQTVKSKYPALAKVLETDSAKGRRALNTLIEAHLHTTWQTTFSSGVAVLNPLPAHSTSLVKPALDLASLLAECPESMLQSSCPPNRPKCNPCVGTKMRVTTQQAFRNISTIFHVSVVPHPYTKITLSNETSEITVAHIRRKTERDEWVTAVTRNLLGDGRGGPSRVVSLKDVVASPYGTSRSIWFATEQFPQSFNPPPPPVKAPTNEAHPEQKKIDPFPEEWLAGLDWQFGFHIPRTGVSHGESMTPVPGPERYHGPPGAPDEKKKSSDPRPRTEKEILIEVELLRKARDSMKSKDQAIVKMREVAEAWNLADTEAWKFVRAYRARSDLERESFEKEESKYAGSDEAHGKTRWWGT